MPLNKPAKDGGAGQTVTSPSAAVTLADVIKNVEASEQRLLKKKLSCKEWWEKNMEFYNLDWNDVESIWNTAQENV